MTTELWWLALAAATFILLHTVVSSTALRAVLVGAIGEGPYLGLFSLAVAGALVWMSMAYAAAPYVALWESSRAVRLTALAVMAPVMVLLVAGLTARKRGPKAKAVDPRLKQLERENARLKRRLEKAETIIEFQKKVSELLGISLKSPDSDGND